MAKGLKNIEKVQKVLGGEIGSFGDSSGSWILIEDEHHSIIISFDGKGNKCDSIQVCKKIYEVVSEPIIAEINSKP